MTLKVPFTVENRIRFQTPTVCELFQSYYHVNHYLKPVDLQQVIRNHSCPDLPIIQQAQKITSLVDVQKVLSEPLTYDPDDILKKNDILIKNGFKILGETPVRYNRKVSDFIPLYTVSEHPLLPGWIIKAGGHRTPDFIIPATANDRNEVNNFTPYDGLMRLEMNQRLRRVAKEMHFDLEIPDEYAVPYPSPSGSDIHHSYFIISKKLDLLSPLDSINQFEAKPVEEQRRIAKTLCTFITKTGYSDTSFNNICLTKTGKIAIVDTEPVGLMVDQADSSRPRGSSLEKCARIGLCNLKNKALDEGLTVFAQVAEEEYQKSLKYTYSIQKIALSILFPLISLVLFVSSMINHMKIGRLARQINESNFRFYLQHADDPPSHSYSRATIEHAKATNSLKTRYLPFVENVFATYSM